MKPAPHSISTQRLDRLLLWSKLSLLRLAAWILQTAGAWAPLERAAQNALTKPIRVLGKIICALIILKASARTPKDTRLAQRKRMRVPRKNLHISAIRQLFGSRLRMLTRRRDLRAKISALLALLHNVEREIARFARRLRKGLTRRCGGVPLSAFQGHVPFAAQKDTCPSPLCDTS